MNGPELKQLREKAGLTQQQLAEKAGLTGKLARQRIYVYEAGTRNMPPAIQKLFSLILK